MTYFENSDTKMQFNSNKLYQMKLGGAGSIALLHTAVDFCAQQMFGIELMTNGMWSDKGQDGEMKFKVMNGTSVLVYSSNGITTKLAKTFSVYNDATSYSYSTLGSLGKGGGGGISRGIYEYYSDITKSDIFTNRCFTASDADVYNPVTPNGVMQLISNFKSIQIHETGNCLSKITGKYKTAGKWTDPSSGITYWFGEDPLPYRSANVSVAAYNAANINSSDYDTGQAFELEVFLKYRQLIGLK